MLLIRKAWPSQGATLAEQLLARNIKFLWLSKLKKEQIIKEQVINSSVLCLNTYKQSTQQYNHMLQRSPDLRCKFYL